VKGKSPVEIRVELARGHFLVGEPAHAIAALEAAVREDPRHPGLRALLEELIADPSTYSVRASLGGVRARLAASVAPAPVAPVVSAAAAPVVPALAAPAPSEPVLRTRAAPTPIALEIDAEDELLEPELELESLAEAAGMYAKVGKAPVALPRPAPVPEKPVAVPSLTAKPAVVLTAKPAAVEPLPAPVVRPASGRAGVVAELERWLRNVPRIKRAEVRA